MLNNTRQGLLHTFLRHSDQWLEFIPELRNIWQRLSPVHQLLRNIVQAQNETSARQAIQAFENDLPNQTDSTFARNFVFSK